jgi:hypothetical protein
MSTMLEHMRVEIIFLTYLYWSTELYYFVTLIVFTGSLCTWFAAGLTSRHAISIWFYLSCGWGTQAERDPPCMMAKKGTQWCMYVSPRAHCTTGELNAATDFSFSFLYCHVQLCYSLRSILLFANIDVFTTKIYLDIFILAKSIMNRRE